ncbi:transferrin-binding protein-like solute binding protein [Moraxella oculi]|uniref:Transferrin-binding protein-like solute binding protein n=1 Tax=Moraxella oculi TaxID=2940516 RepID=A0ABW8U5H7_9GAMM
MQKLNPSYSLVLASLTALSMTACSSGGGSSVPAAKPANVVNSQPSAPTAQTTTIQGNKMNIVNGKANGSTAITNSPSTNKVVVNGQAVDFIPNGFSVRTLNLTASNMARVGGGSNLAYTRYGYVREGKTGEAYLFAQGNPTTKMPTTGTATYTGQGVHFENGANSNVNASFQVNYGDKNLSGTVGNVSLKAIITGNTFAGNQGGISTKGQFYGANAAELGGTYRNADGSVAGAYGAKK